MEDVIQFVIKQKVDEALALLGVSDYSQEPIKEQILTISNFVRDTRLKAGVEDTPACQLNENCSNRQATTEAPLRGSYRVLSNAAKRGQTDYKGLHRPSRKKRLKAGKGKLFSTASMPPDNIFSENDGDSAATQKKDQPNEPTTRRDQYSDATDGTTSNGAAPSHDEIQHVAASQALCVVGLNKTTSLEARQSKTTPSGSPPSTSETTPPSDESEMMIIASQAAVGMNTALTSDVGCRASLKPQSLDIPNLFASALAVKAMETILLDCVSLNYTLAKQTWSPNQKVDVTTSIKHIRRYAESILSWDYEKALQAIKNEHAIFANRDIQARYNKSIYWKIIAKYAELLDPTGLPTAKGRLDEFTMAEKTATRAFMIKAGYGTSYANQRRCRRLWKSLSDMREAGVDKLLFYRTKEFDSFCEQHRTDSEATLVQTVLSWENLYGPHIEQLEERVRRESQGDLTGRQWLAQPHVAKRLDVPKTSWNNDRNMWFSAVEEEHFNLSSRKTQAASDQLGGLLDIPTAEGGNRNKSIFVSLLSWDEGFLSVRPIITIQEGDFLGVFAGMIRYSEEFDSMFGIRGPSENLWLDYSQVTGLLNQMSVSPPEGHANVDLQWELFEESEGKACPLAWRVSVRALRAIKPFEELVRVAPSSEQCLRHRELAQARRGFLK